MMDRHGDEVDRASALVEAERETMIARAREQVGINSIQPDGECHWCGEEIAPPRLFCDGGCASEWDIARKRRAVR